MRDPGDKDAEPDLDPGAEDGFAAGAPGLTQLADTQIAPAVALAAGIIPSGALVGGRYVIQRLIGKGAYGCVFEARHTRTRQSVALKILTRGADAEDLAVKRFLQEGQITAGLRHSNTVRVFDVGRDEPGLLYLAMELLTGKSLKQELNARLQDNRVFTEPEALEIGVAVTRSLSEAHAVGLVHRDLKPDNIFLHMVEGDDRAIVKVLDFGVAKLEDSSLTLGSDSGVPGTPAYMSPEQVQQHEIDGRSDLYSLGVILYALVAGAVPFRGTNAIETVYMHVHVPLPDLRTRAKTPVSAAFVGIVHRALEKDPKRRFASAKAMRDAMEACLKAGVLKGALEGSAAAEDAVSATGAEDSLLAPAYVSLAGGSEPSSGRPSVTRSMRSGAEESPRPIVAPAPAPIAHESRSPAVPVEPRAELSHTVSAGASVGLHGRALQAPAPERGSAPAVIMLVVAAILLAGAGAMWFAARESDAEIVIDTASEAPRAVSSEGAASPGQGAVPAPGQGAASPSSAPTQGASPPPVEGAAPAPAATAPAPAASPPASVAPRQAKGTERPPAPVSKPPKSRSPNPATRGSDDAAGDDEPEPPPNVLDVKI